VKAYLNLFAFKRLFDKMATEYQSNLMTLDEQIEWMNNEIEALPTLEEVLEIMRDEIELAEMESPTLDQQLEMMRDEIELAEMESPTLDQQLEMMLEDNYEEEEEEDQSGKSILQIYLNI
jgi:hypothetical protein